MKLKKRQFARLKDIAELLNQTLPGTGIKLDKLIADIESVQKVKTVQEEPITGTSAFLEVCAKHQKNLDVIRREADEALLNIKKSVYDTAPKIGDVGYFWDNYYDGAILPFYGVLEQVTPSKKNSFRVKGFNCCFENFSKTPPELK